MTFRQTKRLILFDLDGVIVDSRANMELAWQAVREKVGVKVEFARYFALIGLPFADIIARLGLATDLKEIEIAFRLASSQHIKEARFYPGVEETLLELNRRGFLLGIVTSKDALRTSAVLASAPVRFDTIQTPNDRFRGKPAPDHLLAAMAETNVDPAETVYVGDMEPDAEAAARAGVDYFHAEWGFGAKPVNLSVYVKSFPELLAVIVGGRDPAPATNPRSTR